ncbi:hypothetical protein [Priestia taiwanensis]|uniref:hypothetical protein n=1 Tax=Priestia taiwanensis TaxID=1347902 RepID=UPI00166C0089|nr:hypothetical protein [Priestia taiwanensis]MBM7364188.1 hypothetical protein [Priestia taiwanensis]
MLKRISLFLLVCLLFVGCTLAEEQSQVVSKDDKPQVEEIEKKDVTRQEDKQKEDKQKAVKQKEPKPKADMTGEFTVSDVKIEGKDGTYKVTGRVTGKLEKLYYSVEDGHHELVYGAEVPVKGNTFTLSLQFNKKKLPSNGTLILFMYTKNGDKITPVHTSALQQFGP